MYIKDVNNCLTSVEAAYVYSQIEEDKIVYPVADNNITKPENFLTMLGEFDSIYKIAHMDHDVEDPFPFANCDTREINSFFCHPEAKTETNDYLLDLVYGFGTLPLDSIDVKDQDWSILIPFPTYVSTTQSLQDKTGLHYHHATNHKMPTNMAPITTTNPSPNHIRRIFFDKFDKILPQVVAATKVNDLTDIGTTYLGCSHQSRLDPFCLEGHFPIDSAASALGIMPDGQEVDCLIDTGAIRSIMTRAFYEACPSLAKLPRQQSAHKYCLVGNGQRVDILFTIPVQITFAGHTFEINTQVTAPLSYKIFVIGMKSLTEMEALLDTRNNQVRFLNRSAPIYLLDEVIIPPKQFRDIPVYLKFPSVLTGMIIVKLTTYCAQVVTAKVAVRKNILSLHVQNKDETPLTMPKDVHLGFADGKIVRLFPHLKQ